MDAKTIDRETNLALAAGLAAGAMGLVFGTPREAATVAAISSAASRLFEYVDTSSVINLKPDQKRAVGAFIATATLFFVGRNNGFRISGETAVSAFAGNAISHLMLRDKIKSPSEKDKYRTHLFLAAVAAKILGGQGIPLCDTLLGNGFLMVTGLNLAASQVKPHVNEKNKKWVDVGRLGAIFLFNQNSLNIGLPSTANQILNSLLLVEAAKYMFN